MNAIDFISRVGRNLRLSDMLSRTSVRERMKEEEGMSFAEFTYQSFQAYDWFILRDRYNCSIQVGGSDQLGNIVTGYQLLGKLLPDKSNFGLTTALLTDEFGRKFGKTSGSPVWLSDKKMTPFDFYQYFLKVADSEVGRLLQLFTFLSSEEIEQIMSKFLKKKESRYAQERLAEAVTLLVHGSEGLASAKNATSALFNNDVNALSRMTLDEMKRIFGSSANFFQFYLDTEEETTVLDLTMKVKGFSNSKEAGGAIRNGGLYINFRQEKDPFRIISESDDILSNGMTVIRIGKRRFYIINWR